MSSSGVINIRNINPHVLKLEYAVRGPIVTRAMEIERELLQNKKNYPFNEVIKCNIGDCHAVGQQPIKFLRQVVALVALPELMTDTNFPEDAKAKAERILKSCAGGSIGSYSVSTGVEIIRKDCARYIERRDEISSNWEDIFLTGGASEGIKAVLEMVSTQEIDHKRSGIMVPIPQYPLYSATNAEYNAYQIGYYLDEDNDWGISESELEQAIQSVAGQCIPKAIIVINPGNPTGQVLTRADIEMVIKFAKKYDLLILADEVYQFNVYADDRYFVSFKRVLHDMGPEYAKTVCLASFMSSSKGYMGECGFRGGYCELVNWDQDVKAQMYKLLSARLCSSVIGQAVLDVIINPPQVGDESFKEFEQEKQSVLQDLKTKADLVSKAFNSLSGFKCNVIQGAMYAFPKIDLPTKAIDAAIELKQEPDFFYCSKLLEETGVCVVPGSGFGQKPGTYHFRITILPPVEKMCTVVESIKRFHETFMEYYQ